MKFYLVKIQRPCYFPRCDKVATFALYGTGKTHFADYCKEHGEKELLKRNRKVED